MNVLVIPEDFLIFQRQFAAGAETRTGAKE